MLLPNDQTVVKSFVETCTKPVLQTVASTGDIKEMVFPFKSKELRILSFVKSRYSSMEEC